MAEGLSPVEVGKEIGEHRNRHAGDAETHRGDRAISIVEAVLLALVALLAAWSGYAAAKWGTESSVRLAQASAARTEASRANLDAMAERNLDAETFDAWFTAFTAGNPEAIDLAERRFRPEFRVAFDAWMATDPATNPGSPPGPIYMDEYRQPDLERAMGLEDQADDDFREGSEAGATSDDYVRTTIFLATVLFLVGISGHFRVRAARYGLVAVGIITLVIAVARLVTLPSPPG
jgi:hypothetical protein